MDIRVSCPRNLTVYFIMTWRVFAEIIFLLPNVSTNPKHTLASALLNYHIPLDSTSRYSSLEMI